MKLKAKRIRLQLSKLGGWFNPPGEDRCIICGGILGAYFDVGDASVIDVVLTRDRRWNGQYPLRPMTIGFDGLLIDTTLGEEFEELRSSAFSMAVKAYRAGYRWFGVEIVREDK